MPGSRKPLIRTSGGTNTGAFVPLEWAMLGFNTLVWGSSYLFIAISLDAFTPGMVAWLRTILGASVLGLLPAARKRIERQDWGAVMVVAVAGNAGPALLFAMAEQTVESSVAGMLTASVPLATAGVAFALGQRSLRSVHLVGLVGGLIGVILLGLPSVTGVRPAALGVAMVLMAVVGYALNGNVLVPLAQKYGGIRVIFHAQLIGAVLLTPFGLNDLGANRLETGPILALLSLGILSTGVSRVVHATMGSRVGAPRASIVGYLLPVVALILGVLFRGDVVSPLEIIGLGIVLASAFLVSRSVVSDQSSVVS